MANVEKKRKKLNDRIAQLEAELRDALTKKDSNTREISVAGHTTKIAEARAELAKLK